MEKYDSYKDSGEAWLGKVPSTWAIGRLGGYFFERRTKVSDKDFEPLSVTKQGILPRLESAAKTNDGDNRKLVKKGDFVINSRSDRKGSSGIALQDGSVSLINIVMEPDGVEPLFINFLLKSYSFIEEFYRNGHGIVADLWTTRFQEMKNIKIAVPSLPEQTAIATFLDQKTAQIDRAIAQKERLIELLRERKQIVIQQAVTRGLNPMVKMKDSGVEWIGEVPGHWEMKGIGRLGRIVRGASPRPAGHPMYFNGDDVNWITVGDVTRPLGMFVESSKGGLTLAGKSQSRFLNSGTFVLSNSGATLGVPKILKISGCINDGVLAFLDINPLLVSKEFLFFFFEVQTERLRTEMNQGATQPNLNTDIVRKMQIALPSIGDQLKIVDFLKAHVIKVSESIHLQIQQIAKLKEYRTVLIDAAVTGKIRVTS